MIQLSFDNQTQRLTPLEIGIPQGSPISPILFLLYIRETVQRHGLQLSYIDDFSISVASTSGRKNCRTLSLAYKELVEDSIEFDKKKDELIYFLRTRYYF